jgi:hypothetical protein
MSKKAMRGFSTRIAGANKLALDRHFLDHVDV